MRFALILLCALMLVPTGTRSEVKDLSSQPPHAPHDLKDWGLHCFCLGARQTPHAVVRLDDNGRLLYEARGGVTIDQLNARSVPVTQSQMVLLQNFGLIHQKGDVYTTSFPVLDPDDLAILRAKLKTMAVAIEPKIAPRVRSIKATLNRRGFPDSHYAIVFGYALDGLLWDRLRENGLNVETKPDIDHPYWKGAFWAIYPERTGEPGTNQVSSGATALTLTWTDRVSAPLSNLERAPALPVFLKSIQHGDLSKVPPVISQGIAWPLTSSGNLAIPLIHARAGDPLYDQSLGIAEVVAEALQKDPKGKTILASVKHATQSEATLIVAHELIWDIIDALVTTGDVAQPAVLNGATPTPENLRSLLFITVSP